MKRFCPKCGKESARKRTIIANYKTGAYSQREIGAFYQLHPTTIEISVRKSRKSSVPDTVFNLTECLMRAELSNYKVNKGPYLG